MKKPQKYLRFLLMALLIGLIIPASAALAMSGSGTSDDPYLVSTAADLNDVRNNLSAYYKQTADIDIGGYSNWSRIGDSTSVPFAGTYDGAGYKVTGLSLTSTTGNYYGLFGVNTGTIQNLGVSGSITASVPGAGLLAGYNFTGGVIENCYSSGTVTTSSNNAGGLIGTCNSTVRICYSTANVTATGAASTNIGGFVGNTANGSNISKCYATGDVTNSSTSLTTPPGGCTGGFAGISLTSFTNCYATGNVTSASGGCVGGFAGKTGAIGSTLSFTNCYSTGSLNGVLKGGFLGYYLAGTFSGCYFDSTKAEITESIGGSSASPAGETPTAKTTTEMKTASTFGAWDGASIWHIADGSYPSLLWQYPVITSISPAVGPQAGGTSVTITGTGFNSSASVQFGGTVSGSVVYQSMTSLTAASPSHAGGTVHITVSTGSGTSASMGEDQFTYTIPDTIVPTVTDGTITASGISQTGATLSWNKATDDTSTQSSLKYLVYQSDSNNLNSVENIEANGSPLGSYTADIATKDITGLSMGTTYYFNVIVKDEAGNKTCYTAKSVTTLPPTDITSASITGITAPAAGATPITAGSLVPGSASYTVTSLTWQNGDGSAAALTAGGKFMAGSLYQARIVLTSAAGYRFPASGLTPGVNTGTPQAGTVGGGDVSGNTLTFIVAFPATAAKAAAGIAIKTQPSDLSYEDGETLNLTGLVVTLTYNDETTADIALADFSSNGITASPADGATMVYAAHNGQKVLVSCGSYSAQTDALAVSPPNIASAGITGLIAPVTGSAPVTVSSLSSNDTGSYTVTSITWQNGDGSAVTLTGGGKFKASSGYKAVVVLTSAVGHKFPIGGLTPTASVGTPQAGTVGGGNVSGNTLTFTVNFPDTGEKVVTGIAVKTQPGDLYYEYGETLNLTGLVATLGYDDETASDIALADFASNGITASPADGTAMVYATHNGQKVLVSCGSYSAETSALTVYPPNIASAGITGLIAPVTGSAPVTIGSLNSNDEDSYTVTSLVWQNSDGSAVTLTGGGKFKASSGYKSVIVLTSAAGHKFPASGLTPGASAGTPQAGTVGGGNVSGNTLTFDVTFPDTGAKGVTGIAVKNQPNDLNYEEGETLNLAGLVATLDYSDETASDIALADFASNSITASPADGTVLSYAAHDGHTVLVSCGSYTAQTSALTVNPPAPVLAAGTVTRTSDQAATVTFTSDLAGTYYYGIVADGDAAPVISTGGAGNACLAGQNTISLTTLTAGDWDLYLKVKSSAGKVSGALEIDIAAYFVPVAGITDLPDLAWVGAARTLTGMVQPADATNQTIVWSVKNAGTTGAAISGNTFTATGLGIAELTATIKKGASPTNDYTQDFSIEIHPAMVYNTIEDQPDSSTTITAEGVMAQEARLIVTPIADGAADRVELEEQLSQQNAIAAYEVHMEPAEAFTPPLILTFQVDQQYNGRTVYILHKLSNGSTDVYTPTVTNGQALITVDELSPFLLAVDPQVTIETQPQSVLALEGQTAAFHVEVNGLEPLSYRWQRRTGINASWEDITGATGSVYTTTTLNRSHDGYQYRVIVTDVLGNSVTSGTATLSVNTLPSTGDTSRPLFYIFMASLFAALSLLLIRKRRAA